MLLVVFPLATVPGLIANPGLWLKTRADPSTAAMAWVSGLPTTLGSVLARSTHEDTQVHTLFL